jgi:hypothetical protein
MVSLKDYGLKTARGYHRRYRALLSGKLLLPDPELKCQRRDMAFWYYIKLCSCGQLQGFTQVDPASDTITTESFMTNI